MEELPMILFTVIAQMSVGAFLALGFVQLMGRARKIPGDQVDRITDSALFAVGPLLILGFFAAFFHLNDPFHAFNTLRHLGTSWLSRELLFGVLFGALGFIFALCQWNKRLGRVGRDVLAALTALSGIGLLVAMSGVYYSVETIPAWHTLAVPVFFFASAFLTGPLAVAFSLLLVWKRALVPAEALQREPKFAKRHIFTGEITDDLKDLVRSALQVLTAGAAASGLVIMVTYPAYLLGLSQKGSAAAEVASHLSGAFLTWRLIMLGLAVVLAGIFAFTKISRQDPNDDITVLLFGSLFLAIVGELMGRAIHYEGLWHVGLNTMQHVVMP